MSKIGYAVLRQSCGVAVKISSPENRCGHRSEVVHACLNVCPVMGLHLLCKLQQFVRLSVSGVVWF